MLGGSFFPSIFLYFFLAKSTPFLYFALVPQCPIAICTVLTQAIGLVCCYFLFVGSIGSLVAIGPVLVPLPQGDMNVWGCYFDPIPSGYVATPPSKSFSRGEGLQGALPALDLRPIELAYRSPPKSPSSSFSSLDHPLIQSGILTIAPPLFYRIRGTAGCKPVSRERELRKLRRAVLLSVVVVLFVVARTMGPQSRPDKHIAPYPDAWPLCTFRTVILYISY